MERETQTFMLPNSNVKVVTKTYATAKEAKEIQRIYLEKSKFKVVNGQPIIEDITAGVQDEVESKMIEILVISIGDSTEKLSEIALDLHSKDYNFLIAELNKLTSDEEAKKK